tara:strand:+ start:560 stop:1021 length:462 start_codon:yes stop_codon:yes gene_type:complete
MNRILIILITLTFSVLSCKVSEKITENLSCDGNIEIQYDRTKLFGNDNPKADRKLDAFQVIFLSDFDENIKAYINNKLVFDEYVTRGPNSHSLENTFGYNYKSDLKIPILKVESVEKGTCVDFEINKKYKIIYLFIDENGKWIVRFSNEYYLI